MTVTATSGVVERCPNCGTTQAIAGECDACHEAQVRYFCTNHDPGIWLAGATCPQCAARASAARAPVDAPPPRARPASPGREASLARAPRERPRARPVDDAAGVEDESLDVRPSPLWATLLRGAASALSRTTPPAELAPERPSVGAAGGWLLRLILRLAVIAVVLVIAAVVALYWFASSLN
jgi:hypothetical protein